MGWNCNLHVFDDGLDSGSVWAIHVLLRRVEIRENTASAAENNTIALSR